MITMSVQTVRDALLSVVERVYHYHEQSGEKLPYAIYGETAAPVVVSGDDTPAIVSVRGEIYYYTNTEFDTAVDEICDALTDAGVSWTIDAIGYTAEDRRIMYQIHWEVPCGAGEIYR